MQYSTPERLGFPPTTESIVRADFEGGAWSSDFGALLLRSIDRRPERRVAPRSSAMAAGLPDHLWFTRAWCLHPVRGGQG
jgi:hypothetical protein